MVYLQLAFTLVEDIVAALKKGIFFNQNQLIYSNQTCSQELKYTQCSIYGTLRLIIVRSVQNTVRLYRTYVPLPPPVLRALNVWARLVQFYINIMPRRLFPFLAKETS